MTRNQHAKRARCCIQRAARQWLAGHLDRAERWFVLARLHGALAGKEARP